jgi:hypothetical protein
LTFVGFFIAKSLVIIYIFILLVYELLTTGLIQIILVPGTIQHSAISTLLFGPYTQSRPSNTKLAVEGSGRINAINFIYEISTVAVFANENLIT